MTSKLRNFSNPQFGNVRIVINEDNEPLFCLADLCTVIGIVNPRNVKTRLEKEDVHQIDTPTTSGIQSITFVSESGMYDVIMRSDSEKVKPFRKWVTGEILPSIRKHGAYMTPQKIEEALLNPDILIQLATNLKEEQKKRIQAEKENQILKPKAALMDKILNSGEKIDIGQTAKILSLPFGRNTLFKKLRELGVFFKNRNEPKQEYIDRKYFELKEDWIDRNNHEGFMVVKVLVTQKGLEYINKLLQGSKSDGKKLKLA